jgi:hypothetical protein
MPSTGLDWTRAPLREIMSGDSLLTGILSCIFCSSAVGTPAVQSNVQRWPVPARMFRAFEIGLKNKAPDRWCTHSARARDE